MLKKLVFAVVLVSFAAFSAAAQTKVDRYLGTWKMTKIEGYLKGTTIKSMVMSVSEVGGEFKIVNETAGVSANKQSYSTTRTSAYKVNGASTTNIIPGQFGGVVVSYLDFTGKNKLRLRNTVQKTEEGRQVIPFGSTEYWTVSDDGKTLTVEIRTAYNSSKAIFVKE